MEPGSGKKAQFYTTIQIDLENIDAAIEEEVTGRVDKSSDVDEVKQDQIRQDYVDETDEKMIHAAS